MILNDGLEEIGAYAFTRCESLHEIVIPNAIKWIRYEAFCHFMGLMAVTHVNGLEEIWLSAFA